MTHFISDESLYSDDYFYLQILFTKLMLVISTNEKEFTKRESTKSKHFNNYVTF